MLCIIVPNWRIASLEFFSCVLTHSHCLVILVRFVHKGCACNGNFISQPETMGLPLSRSKVSDAINRSIWICTEKILFLTDHKVLHIIRCHDGDDNQNAKKNNGLTRQSKQQHAFLYICWLHEYHLNMPYFTFCGGRKQALTKFSPLFDLGYGRWEFSSWRDHDNHDRDWKKHEFVFVAVGVVVYLILPNVHDGVMMQAWISVVSSSVFKYPWQYFEMRSLYQTENFLIVRDNTPSCTNSREELRRSCSPIGHNNTKRLLCPIRSQHSLDRLDMVRWESVSRGSSARAWNISSRLFSRPNWLRLGLRGWWPLRSCLSNIALTRRHGWTNYNQRFWKGVSLTVYYNGFGDIFVSLVTVILLLRRFCIDGGDCS